MSDARVFVSMGDAYLPRYAEFKEELERFLTREGIDARIIGVNEHPPGSPLPYIRDVVRTCHGVLVVAFERRKILSGIEKPGGATPLSLDGQSFTTPWNHVEAAIAFSMGIPLYIISETNLKEEALIEMKVDWYVQRMELTKEALWSTPVRESLTSWLDKRVKPAARAPRFLKAFQGSLKLSEMRPKEIWSVVTILSAVFLAGIAVGRWIIAFPG